MCFFIKEFTAEVRSGNYSFGRDVKVLTHCKETSDINDTTSMASNRRTGPLKMIEKNGLDH